MNIAIVIPTIEAGGAEKQAVILAKCLSSSHRVYFYLFFGDLPKEQKHINVLEASGVKIISLMGSLREKVRNLSNSLVENNVEIALNYLTMCDGAGCYAERKAGVRYIYNGIRNAHLSLWKEVIERYCNNHWATGTIFNSYSAEKFFAKRGFSRDKLIVIPNCFPEISPVVERTDKEAKIILTVGRFDPAKDYETSIRAIATARKDNPSIRYRIVGYGALETTIRKWVSQYGIQDITEIFINPANIPELLMSADVFLSTSLYEGTSNAIMEALNASLPVVCTNVGDNEYLVKDGHSGFIHKIGDVSAISDSLLRLISEYKLRRDFGRVANQNLHDNYSIEVFASRYNDLLEKCKI